MKDNFKIKNNSAKISEICIEYAIISTDDENDFITANDLYYYFKLKLLRQFDEKYDGKIIRYVDENNHEHENINDIEVNCILKTPEGRPYWISTQLTLGEDAIKANDININSLPLDPKDFDIYDYVPYAPSGLSMEHL